QLSERIHLIPKVFIEAETELLLHFGFDQYEIAEEPIDDRTPQPVFGGYSYSPHRRPGRIVNSFVVGRQISPVLGVSVLESADCADPESIEVAPTLGSIALEVPVQRAVTLRGHELVRRQGEVVHPDVPIAGFRKLAGSKAEYPELLELLRKMSREAPLLLLEPGNVSVTEQGNPVRPHPHHFAHSVSKAF